MKNKEYTFQRKNRYKYIKIQGFPQYRKLEERIAEKIEKQKNRIEIPIITPLLEHERVIIYF